MRQKSITVWILSILLILIVSGCMAQDPKETKKREINPDNPQSRLFEMGYLDHVADDADPQAKGAKTLSEISTSPGVNAYSGSKTPYVTLIDSKGEQLHQWSMKIPGEWSGFRILKDGGIVGVFVHNEKHWLIRTDKDSNIIWSYGGGKESIPLGSPHHDLWVTNNLVYVLTSKNDKTIVHDGLNMTIRDDYISVFHIDGKWLAEKSIHEMFKGLLTDEYLDYKKQLYIGQQGSTPADLYHTNSLIILDRDIGIASPGDILLCMRHINTVAIIKRESGSILWHWGQGDLEYPHKPFLTSKGNLLIFDNGLPSSRNWSRIVEIDPRTNETVWEYKADPPNLFFSDGRGEVSELENGNLLISESQRGRAFEVTRDGEKVWEFFNPHIDDPGKRSIIYQMRRYKPGSFVSSISMTHGIKESLAMCAKIKHEWYSDKCKINVAARYELIESCLYMQPKLRDDCVIDVAKQTLDPTHCEMATNRTSQNTCIHSIATNQSNKSLCKAIDDQLLRERCIIDIAIKNLDLKGCNATTNEKLSDYCIFKIGKKKSDIKICGQIKNPLSRGVCVSEVSNELNFPVGCMRVENIAEKHKCLWNIAKRTRNPDVCYMLTDARIRENCQRMIEAKVP